MTLSIFHGLPHEPAAYGIRLKHANGRRMAQALDALGRPDPDLPEVELPSLPGPLITRCAAAGRAMWGELRFPLAFLLVFDFASRTWRDWVPLQVTGPDGTRIDLSSASLAGLPPTARAAGTFVTSFTTYRDINEALPTPAFDGLHFTQMLERFLSILVVRERVEGVVCNDPPEKLIAVEAEIPSALIRERIRQPGQ